MTIKARCISATGFFHTYNFQYMPHFNRLKNLYGYVNYATYNQSYVTYDL